MQWKPHSCILTCPEYKFKSWLKLIKFNILHKVSSNKSSLFTVTLLTEGLGHREQRGAIGDQSETLPHLHINIVEILEIRNYRNLYFDQKAKENAWSLWGNNIEKDQVERIELKCDPKNGSLQRDWAAN